MRYPEFLKENGAIGFVAPSFGAATEPYRSAFDNALKKFHALESASAARRKTAEGKSMRQ